MSYDADFYFQRGRKTWLHDNLRECLTDLGHAIELAPNNPEYYLERGRVFERLEEYALAIADFSKVVEISVDLDDLREAHSWRATCSEAIGNVEQLLEDTAWLIEHSFASTNNYLWRATWELRLGLVEAAINDCTSAIELDPKHNDARLKRAHAYYEAHSYDDAIRDLRQILASGQDMHPAYHGAVRFWLNKVNQAKSQ